MKVCKNCEKEIPDNASFCPYCGEDQREKVVPRIRYCKGCGEELKAGYINCPNCGRPVENQFQRQQPHVSQPRPDSESAPKAGNVKPQTTSSGSNIKDITYPKGLLKVLSIVLGAVYAYMALTYLPYLSYYAAADKTWGVFMIVSCVWCSFILFVIAFRCRKQYGLHLLYALAGGEILKCILHIINIQRMVRYEYWSGSSAKYLSIAGTVVTVVICWYAMKKEDMLLPVESGNFVQTAKEIPRVLRNIFSGNGSTQNGHFENREKTLKQPKTVIRPGTEGEKILLAVCSNIFLILGVLYTVNIVFGIFSSFAFFKLVTGFLSIMMCIAIWMIYYNGKKGILDGTGFSIVNGVTLIRFIVRIVISLILIIIAASAGAGVGGCLILALVMALDLYYWWSIWKMFHSMQRNTRGITEEVHAGIYPIFILGINVFIKVALFAFASFMQATADNLTGTLNQYGNSASSAAGMFTNMLGLGYGLGWGQSSEFIQSILQPINEAIQESLGYSQNPFLMIVAIVIPVLEILLLIKLRSFADVSTEEQNS